MNKSGLVAEVAKRTGTNKADVARVLDSTMAVIRDTVAQGHRVTLVDFGTFARVRRNKRLARNPRQPEQTVTVPARDVPSFSPGERFKRDVAAKRRRAASTSAKPSRAPAASSAAARASSGRTRRA